MSTNAVTQPDSAPATQSTELQIPSGPAYDKWRMTGEMPSEKTEESAPSEPETTSSEGEESATSQEQESVTRAASEAAPPQKGKKDASARIRELVARNQELERQLSAHSETSVTQTSQPATEQAVTDAGPTGEEKNPDGSWVYKDWKELNAAQIKWALAKAEEQHAQREREAIEAQHERIIQEVWTERLTEAKKRLHDFDVVCSSKEICLPKGSIPDQVILDSERGPDILYYFGQHPEEMTRITGFAVNPKDPMTVIRVGAGLNTVQQAREMFKIESQYSVPPPAKRVTNAPPPPKETGGRGSTSPDEVEQAVKEEDFSSYAAAANRRDVARRKGK
jgi:hypothetical protein